MSLEQQIEQILKFIKEVCTPFEFYDCFPAIYYDKESYSGYRNLFSISEEMKLTLKDCEYCLQEKRNILIFFSMGYDDDDQHPCLDGIERPLPYYDFKDYYTGFTENMSIAFLITIGEEINIIPGIADGLDDLSWMFTPSKLHEDLLRAFEVLTKEYFHYSLQKLAN